MASINGISVKGLKEFKGHEGEPLYQGNLYLNNKKIGFWSQDGWGGPDNVMLDNGFSEQLLNKAVHNLNEDKDYYGKANVDGSDFVLEYNLERLMGDYISLYEDEKAYKNALKKGYEGVLIASDGYHQVSWALPHKYVLMPDDELFKEMESDINNAKSCFLKENEFTKHTIKVYRSSNDFILGESIKLKDIIKKPKLQESIDFIERNKSTDNPVVKKDELDRDLR